MRTSIEAELAAKLDARITPAAFIAFAELAVSHPALRTLLICRPDLPDEAAGRLWPHLSQAEKAALLLAGAPYGEREAVGIADKAKLILHALLRRGELPHCLNLLAMRSSRGSALLCRAAGLSRVALKDIARMRRDLGHQVLGAPDAGADILDETSKEVARRLLAAYEAASSGGIL
jgi:hypothetical protein